MGGGQEWTETIQVFPPAEKVGALFEMLFKFSCSSAKICPLSAMIADFHSLPKSMRKPLKKVFQFQEEWLQGVIEDGQKSRIFRRDLKSKELAELVMSISFGSQLIARLKDDAEHLHGAKSRALSLLEAST